MQILQGNNPPPPIEKSCIHLLSKFVLAQHLLSTNLLQILVVKVVDLPEVIDDRKGAPHYTCQLRYEIHAYVSIDQLTIHAYYVCFNIR